MKTTNITIYSEDPEDYGHSVGFLEGVLSAACYSYHIDSHGYFVLNREETRKVYETMRRYYETKESTKQDR